jgi:hypothetical protein
MPVHEQFYRPLRRRWTQRCKPELILNGDLESFTGTVDDGSDDTFTSWTRQGTGLGDLVEATATAWQGGYAAKLTRGNNGCNINQTFTVASDKRYKLVFWSRGDGSVAGLYNLYDATNSAYILTNTSTGNTTTTYDQVAYSFAAPSGCVSLKVTFSSPGSNGSAYYDSISVRLA